MKKGIVRSIELRGETFSYALHRRRGAKYVRLAITHEGKLRVTAPWSVGNVLIEQFLHAQHEWLSRMRVQRPLSDFSEARRKQYLLHKERARALAMDRIAYFAPLYGVNVARVSIRNQHSRWGSCSKKGNVSLHFAIALFPSELADYVIIHELCHLREFNHSPAFWHLVAEQCPQYKELRKLLRAQQHTLFRGTVGE